MNQQWVAVIITFVAEDLNDGSDYSGEYFLDDVECQIGCTLVNGKRHQYAAAAQRICVLDGPLLFNWMAPCAIQRVELVDYHGYTEERTSIHKGSGFVLNNPADLYGMSVCSSRKMKALQSREVASVGRFFWDQYPVSEYVADL